MCIRDRLHGVVRVWAEDRPIRNRSADGVSLRVCPIDAHPEGSMSKIRPYWCVGHFVEKPFVPNVQQRGLCRLCLLYTSVVSSLLLSLIFFSFALTHLLPWVFVYWLIGICANIRVVLRYDAMDIRCQEL